jgi:hypothetical protein
MRRFPWPSPIQAGQDRAIRLAHPPFHSLCPRMLCTRCGHRGSDVRPDRQPECASRLISEQPARMEDGKRGFAALSRSRAGLDSQCPMPRASSFQAPKRKQGACWKLPRLLSENIDRLQALGRACVHVPGTHDQASAIVPCAVKSGVVPKLFARRAQVLILPCFTEALLRSLIRPVFLPLLIVWFDRD